MEVDGGILGGIVAPALGGSVPASAGDGARRMLVGKTPVPADGVHQPGARHVLAEVPCGHHVSALHEARRLDAAVEAGHAMPRRKLPIPGRATDAEGAGGGTSVLRRLRHGEPPHRGTQGGLVAIALDGDAMPAVGGQWRRKPQRVAVGLQREVSILDAEREAAGAGENCLPRAMRRGGHDVASERQCVERWQAFEGGIRAGFQRLEPGRVDAAQRGFDEFLLIAGAAPPGVAANEPHQVCLERVAGFAAHHHLKPLSGRHGERLHIGDDSFRLGRFHRAKSGRPVDWQ